jgi:hypothetical protein
MYTVGMDKHKDRFHHHQVKMKVELPPTPTMLEAATQLQFKHSIERRKQLNALRAMTDIRNGEYFTNMPEKESFRVAQCFGAHLWVLIITEYKPTCRAKVFFLY